MKKILTCLAFVATAICLSSPTAWATPATCTALDDVLVANYSCTLGGLTFSNFSSNTTNPLGIKIGAADSNPVGISFDPNIPYGSNPVIGDIYLQFKITGGITGVTLAVNGGSANENVCAVAQGTMAVNLGICSNGNVIAGPIYASVGSPGSATFALAQTAWIYKDINSGVGLLSEVDQGYTSAVPEPMTLSMMGAGLLGLGLISRRKKS